MSQEVLASWEILVLGAVYRLKVDLTEGSHNITLHYIEDTGDARLNVYWYQNPGEECTTSGNPSMPQ